MELKRLEPSGKSRNPRRKERPPGIKLLALLQQQSRGPIARMRRNLRKEAILMLVSYIPVSSSTGWPFDGLMSGVGWLFVVLLLFF